MNRRFGQFNLRRLGLALAILLVLQSKANADLPFTDLQLYDGGNAPTVYMTFTNSGGSVDVYADPQTGTDANWQSNGSPIPMYCIDTVHDNYLGSSYTVNIESTPYFSTNPANVSVAANEVAWAIENASTGNTTADVYNRAATQLFIWSVIDPKFSVTNWNGFSSATPTSTALGTVQGDYNALVSLAGYNANLNYVPGATFLGAVHDSTNTLYQDLAYASGGSTFTPQSIVPEPSTMAIAGLGALGLIGYGLRKRARP